MKLYVSRKFSAAHYLTNYDGPCARLHGHTWKVEVWLTGPVNPATGMVVDFKSVKDIIDVLDHHCLNDLFNLPTAENVVTYLCQKFVGLLGIDTVRVRLWESENSYAEVSSE